MVDELDARILQLFTEEPRVGVLEASRRLGVARGTVQARLDKLTATGVVRSFAPSLDPAAMGFRVTAFATLEIRQGGRGSVAAHLARIPEVLEVHNVAGEDCYIVKIVATAVSELDSAMNGLAEFGSTTTSVVVARPLEARVMGPPPRPAAGDD